MYMNSTRMENAWKGFIYDGLMDESLNPIISQSWERCKGYGVNHLDGTGKKISGKEFDLVVKNNEELLKIARPIMKNLHDIVVGSHYALILTDKHGHIIEAIGDKIVRDRANKIRFELGSLWSEEAVGTNAIGTCLILDRPLQIIGEEHYCISHHSWTCSATTIHNVDGEIIGCLNMSGNSSQAHCHTLGIVVAAAYTIENEMALLRSYELIETTFESTTDGIIVIDNHYRINRLNKEAMIILGINEEDIGDLDIKEILKDMDFYLGNRLPEKNKPIYLTDFNLYIKNRRISCSANIIPMVINNEIVGFNIGFKETKYLHKTVNKVTGNIATYTFDNIITMDKKMEEIISSAKKMGKYKRSVLIEGESGTGKELFAHAIHNCSQRCGGPFVAVNCASLPRDLIESELFGYEKGAFTGALRDGNPGKFELADGGSIFLDEIGEMPLELQAKLLRVLDSMTIRRIGGRYEKKLDIRIIAATNRNLFEEVQKKNFREDLYYRLNVLKLEIPPLRKRRGDIVLCAEHFLKNLNHEHLGNTKSFSDDFIQYLKHHKWVGNVRELQNFVERAYYLCDEEVITPACLPDNAKEETSNSKDKTVSMLLVDTVMKNNIELMLKNCNGNVLEAAKRLNMSKSAIYRRIKKYGIHNIKDMG